MVSAVTPLFRGVRDWNKFVSTLGVFPFDSGTSAVTLLQVGVRQRRYYSSNRYVRIRIEPRRSTPKKQTPPTGAHKLVDDSSEKQYSPARASSDCYMLGIHRSGVLVYKHQ